MYMYHGRLIRLTAVSTDFSYNDSFSRASHTFNLQVYMVAYCGRLLAIQFLPKMVNLCCPILIMYMAYSVFKVYDIYHLW